MDEAWELLNRDPPLVWIIKIKELPKERDLRISEERNARMSHLSRTPDELIIYRCKPAMDMLFHYCRNRHRFCPCNIFLPRCT
jgi:hypothetical protein